MMDIIRGLSKASVRNIITIALTATVIYLACKDKIEARDVMLTYSNIVSFYFGGKMALEKPTQ